MPVNTSKYNFNQRLINVLKEVEESRLKSQVAANYGILKICYLPE